MFNENNKNIINCKLGKASVHGIVTAGYAFMVLGIFPLLTLSVSGYIAGGALIIFGSFLSFTTSGVDIDVENRRLYNYLAFFGIVKSGNWIDIKGFNYITVLMFNKEQFKISKPKKTTQQSEKNYEIYLIDNSKVNRQIIATFRHAKSAIEFAKKMAETLNIKYINYHPEKGWE